VVTKKEIIVSKNQVEAEHEHKPENKRRWAQIDSENLIIRNNTLEDRWAQDNDWRWAASTRQWI